MKTTTTHTTITCDACGKELQDGDMTHPNQYVPHSLLSLHFTYQEKVFSIQDVCDDCNQKIMWFLINNGIAKHSHRAE